MVGHHSILARIFRRGASFPSREPPAIGPSDLNASQRRHLATALALTERRLLTWRHWLTGHADSGCLACLRDDLTASEGRAALAHIDIALQRLAALAGRLRLAREPRSLRRSIAGAAVVTTTHLLDAKSRRLRGYGRLDGDTAAWLDPAIDEVVAALESVIASLRAPHATASSTRRRESTCEHPTSP